MLIRPISRYFISLTVAFALLWSFLMPTAERVVTPVSQSIPAVSAPASIHSHIGGIAQVIQKQRIVLLLVAVLFPLVQTLCRSQIRIRLGRFASSISLLRKQLFLRPLKFTSLYVHA